jgi:diguanylate cyclase (GGDEF)-like protein
MLTPKYKIYASRDGIDAIETARAVLPDLILLDIVMPEINGFEVLSRLKNMDETRDVPVIFVTGQSTPEDEERGLLLGAADYINKPLTDSIVKLRVKIQIQLINQMKMIRKLSITDALTNTSNRRHFNAQYEKEWRRNMRDSQPLSLLMIDFDNFKQFNDNYGHLQGDSLLKAVSGVIQQRLNRPMDMLARWGGEEFIVMLPCTDMQGAMIMAELIRHDVESYVFECFDGSRVNVTVSIGVSTTIPETTDSAEKIENESQRLFAAADSACYKAKQTGRNKVCYADY